MIAIVDYSVGNLFSLSSSLKAVGAETVVTGDADVLRKADKILLPGVGAFSDAITKLRATGLDKVIVEETKNGKQLLGICLGMQMLFEKSYEYGEHDGLGLLGGEVVPMQNEIPRGYKIPNIGWNSLQITKENRLFKNIKDGDFVYFVHSYFVKGCDDSLLALTDYGSKITAAVEKGNIFGCQFHPEKSGKIGLEILRGFAEL